MVDDVNTFGVNNDHDNEGNKGTVVDANTFPNDNDGSNGCSNKMVVDVNTLSCDDDSSSECNGMAVGCMDGTMDSEKYNSNDGMADGDLVAAKVCTNVML